MRSPLLAIAIVAGAVGGMTLAQPDGHDKGGVKVLSRNEITEKIDGTNAAVVLVPYQQADVDQLPFSLATVPDPAHGMYLSVLAQSRSRYLTAEQDNFGFAAWVKAHAEELAALGPGVHFGEWWGKGIQRGYGLDEKRFSLFNVSRWYGAEGPRTVSGPLARHEGLISARRACFIAGWRESKR